MAFSQADEYTWSFLKSDFVRTAVGNSLALVKNRTMPSRKTKQRQGPWAFEANSLDSRMYAGAG